MAVDLGGLTINNPLASSGSSSSTPSSSSSGQPSSPGTYWIGQDGNVWVAGSQGVHSAGKADINTGQYWNSRGYQLQNDPNAGNGSTTSNTNNGYGSSNNNSTNTNTPAASTYQDKTNDIAVQNAGLGQVDATQNTGLNTVQDAFDKIMGQYNTEGDNARTSYTNEGDANQTDLQGNKETALQNAVQGRQGLYGTLASLGALSGTGLTLANDAVQKGANSDLTTAANTFATNQNALDSGYGAFKAQDDSRKQQLTTNKANNDQQIRNDAVKTRQSYLTNLSNDYTAEGNTDQAKSYSDQAAALFPAIASTNVPAIDLGYSGSAYTAPTLSSYVGKANNTTVKTTPSAGDNGVLNIPGLIATNRRQGAGAPA